MISRTMGEWKPAMIGRAYRKAMARTSARAIRPRKPNISPIVLGGLKSLAAGASAAGAALASATGPAGLAFAAAFSASACAAASSNILGMYTAP